MELSEVIRRRRMVRNYTGEPLPDGAIDRMLQHAVRAPNAGFTQGWAFLVLESDEERERFWTATSPPGADSRWLRGMRTAPAIIVPLANKDAYLDRYAEPDKGWTDRDVTRWSAPYWDIDTGMAALLILLTAVDEHLGACFFGIPPGRLAEFRTAFDVPEAYRPIGAITVGYPAPDHTPASRRRGRRPMAEVVHHGRFRAERPGHDDAPAESTGAS